MRKDLGLCVFPVLEDIMIYCSNVAVVRKLNDIKYDIKYSIHDTDRVPFDSNLDANFSFQFRVFLIGSLEAKANSATHTHGNDLVGANKRIKVWQFSPLYTP